MSSNLEEQTNKDEVIQTKEHVVTLDPLLFHIRDHEPYFTAYSGPRYNEYAIFFS